MAQLQIYTAGQDSWSRWDTGSFKFALLKGGSFDRDHDHVDDVVSGGQRVTVSGYADVAPDTPTRTVNTTTDHTEYTIATNPDFGTLAAGENVIALLVYEFITNDAGSIPMGRLALTSTATDAFDPFVVTITDLLVAHKAAGAGS